MSEPTRVLEPERPADPAGYRPVAGLAVAAFALSAFYAALVLVMGLAAYATGTPWVAPGLLLLPVVGGVLALTAGWQIRRSEGTRAGAALARWAGWLSLLAGLGYGAYIAAAELAIRQQARTFTDGWFDLLRQDKPYHAFHQTLDPKTRQGDNPDDLRRMMARYYLKAGALRGPLPDFFDSSVVRVVQLAGPAAECESQGVRSWTYERGSYTVEQNYRVRTPEGQFDIVVLAKSTAGAGSQPLQWQVLLNEQMVRTAPRLSHLGSGLLGLRKDALTFLEGWARKLQQGQLEAAFLDTCEPARRAELGQAVRAGREPPAEYKSFQAGRLVSGDGLLASSEDVRVKALDGAKSVFRPKGGAMLRFGAENMRQFATPWELDGEELRLRLPAQVAVTSQKVMAEAFVHVAARDPELVAKVTRLREHSPDSAAIVKELHATQAGQHPWRITGVELRMAIPMPDLPQ